MRSLLSIVNINKSFYSQKALIDVSFEVNGGEIIGLLGANGAGKSTLLKIIGGTLQPDSGQIELSGKKIENHTPFNALKMGIISVYQELNLFSHLTVAENLFIGREIKSRAGTIDWNQTNKKAQKILDEYELVINAGTLVSSLSVAKQHMVEIARAFNENPKILLLDEPTSALSETEIEWLFNKIKSVAKSGTTVIYVSHRLDEVASICERNVILRDGQLVHCSTGSMEKSDIIHHIVGHDVVLNKAFSEKNNNDNVFECRNIVSKNGAIAQNFFVRKGEILGIAGLVGSGRTELIHTIFGIDPLLSGTIKKNGKTISIKSPSDAIKHGIILVPEDRKTSGLFLNESARFNIASITLDNRAKSGFVDSKLEKQAVKESASQVLLDTDRLEHFVRLLSGGNQQKVVIAKTLLVNSDILILDEPTRGVDIGAREEIYQVIKTLAEKGKSIILVTSDWEELIYLSHRVMVMSEMNMVAEIQDDITESAIMHAAEKPQLANTIKEDNKESGFSKFYSRILGNTNNNFLLLLLILVVLLIIGSAINPFFRTWTNYSNLFGQSTPLLILALGQLFVIIAGGIDISSGALMAASGVIGLTLMTQLNIHPLLGVGVMLCFGVLVGITNAFLIQRAKVNPFVVTIGMMLVLEGIALLVSPKPIGPSPSIFRVLFDGKFIGIPSAFILLIIFIPILFILLRYTALGRGFYAIGENKIYSFNAGLNVNRITYSSYILSSVMAVLAAIYVLGRFGGADPVLGPGMELEAIACVLIGGATLAGGRGSIAGTVCGVFVLGVMENLFSLMDVNIWYQQVITGVILLIIIASNETMYRNKQKS